MFNSGNNLPAGIYPCGGQQGLLNNPKQCHVALTNNPTQAPTMHNHTHYPNLSQLIPNTSNNISHNHSHIASAFSNPTTTMTTIAKPYAVPYQAPTTTTATPDTDISQLLLALDLINDKKKKKNRSDRRDSSTSSDDSRSPSPIRGKRSKRRSRRRTISPAVRDRKVITETTYDEDGRAVRTVTRNPREHEHRPKTSGRDYSPRPRGRDYSPRPRDYSPRFHRSGSWTREPRMPSPEYYGPRPRPPVMPYYDMMPPQQIGYGPELMYGPPLVPIDQSYSTGIY